MEHKTLHKEQIEKYELSNSRNQLTSVSGLRCSGKTNSLRSTSGIRYALKLYNESYFIASLIILIELN